MTPLSFNADHFRRDSILVVSSMYVLYAMKLLRKYTCSNDAMLCLTPNLTYALIHEVTVEKLWEVFLYFLCNQCTSLLKALWGRKCHSIVISSYDFRFFYISKEFPFLNGGLRERLNEFYLMRDWLLVFNGFEYKIIFL